MDEAVERGFRPIESGCSRRYTAVHTSGRRPLSSIELIVIHCTQSDRADTAAAWFGSPRSQGSSHLVVDDDECYRTLRNSDVPWGAKGANRRGFHIEIAGWVFWDRLTWLSHGTALQRAAYKAALHALRFDVPLRLLSVAQLRGGSAGFATHARCSRAFGGDHFDPGDGFPLDLFMAWTRDYARRLRPPAGAPAPLPP